MSSYFNAGSADLSESWVSYSSDQPIFAYGTVSDDRTADPTLIPASEDSGVQTVTPPADPVPTAGLGEAAGEGARATDAAGASSEAASSGDGAERSAQAPASHGAS